MAAAPEFKQALDAFNRGDLDSARVAAEAAVSAAPSPQWQHLLGLIHCRLGNPATGVEHLQAAAEGDPGNVPYRVMLARALIDVGRASEVLAMQEPPPIVSPAELALWQSRAEAADACGQPQIATKAWEKITAAVPRDWRAWGNFGNSLASQGRLLESAEALAEAARLNPAEPAVRDDARTALVNAGRLHQSLLRFDDAAAAFQRALELDPADRATIYLLGAALERTNRLDDLRKLLDQAASAGLGKEALGYLWALLAWREGRVEESKELLATSNPSEDPVAWNALRAKIADALGESDEAFEAAVAMNAAALGRAVPADQLDSWETKSRRYREEQHHLARTITPEWAAQVPLLQTPWSKRVAFLLGFPRSGTTLLDTFLLGHPDVAVLEERQLVARSAQVVGRTQDLPRASLPRLRKARTTYLGLLANELGQDFAGLVVDKFPLDMGLAPLIQAILPGSPMIFAQRHPCDVVLSGFLQPFGTVNFSNIEAAADYYDAMMSIWTAARDTMDLNVHTVVYEELVADPEATLRPLIDFLGLDWDDRILDHTRTAKSRGTIVTPSYDQVTEPVTTRPVGRWKRYRKQLEPALPILLPWAERLGYRD